MRIPLATALRWMARIWSLASLLFVLAFVIGEIFHPSPRPPSESEWVGLALWPIGTVVGVFLAWRHEAWGAALTAACLIAFYAWGLISNAYAPAGPWFVLVAAPAFMFLLAKLSRPSRLRVTG